MLADTYVDIVRVAGIVGAVVAAQEVGVEVP